MCLECRRRRLPRRTLRSPGRVRCAETGFTLVELVLATFISGLVIAVVSVALSFSLRLWERNQYRDPAAGPRLLDLLNLQLSSFYPFPVRFEEGQRPLVIGSADSLLLATGYSVRALSQGAPVIARYQVVESEHRVYYAEMPLDPYHPERLKEFLAASPDHERTGAIRFFAVDAHEWVFSYWDSEAEDYADHWENPTAVPMLVRVAGAWDEKSPVWARLFTVGALFPEGNRVENP